jgi:hypothetical protein
MLPELRTTLGSAAKICPSPQNWPTSAHLGVTTFVYPQTNTWSHNPSCTAFRTWSVPESVTGHRLRLGVSGIATLEILTPGSFGVYLDIADLVFAPFSAQNCSMKTRCPVVGVIPCRSSLVLGEHPGRLIKSRHIDDCVSFTT